MNDFEAGIRYLAKRYAKYGFSEQDIRMIVGINKDEYPELDDAARLSGVRLALAMQFGEHELFAVEDVCHITGETRDEVISRAKEEGVNLTSVTVAPWLNGYLKEGYGL